MQIFHGDNQFESRSAFNKYLDENSNCDILRLDQKEADVEKINNFINSRSLFSTPKILALTNFFSVNKSIQDKIAKIINSCPDCDFIFWQDKLLTVTQLKLFPKSKNYSYKLDNELFTCLNSIKPGNLKTFIPLYHQVIQSEFYDLFLYLFKNNLRKQLSSYSRFDLNILKSTYLQLVELDFQNKTGQLSIPKTLALERIIINLIK
jgi:hypothetical protein